jgi:glycosyltransferase involved in cell wall biosynthesis
LRAAYGRVTAPISKLIQPVGRKLRILTFNTHEGYNHALARTGHDFAVVIPASRGLWQADWDTRNRPIPSNVRIVGRVPDLDVSRITNVDLILPQTLEQFELVEYHPAPKLFLAHTAISVAGSEWPSVDSLFRYTNWRRRLASVPIVYVSEYARQTWDLPGRVIDFGFDQRDYAPYRWRGGVAKVLTVSHFFRERVRDTGYDRHRQVLGDDIPYKIVGNNPDLPESGPAPSWDELRRFYQRYAVYFDPTGGSLALLEAAAVGMPIVGYRRSIGQNRFWDGYDAFYSDDLERLRAGVLRLLEDRGLAQAMGDRVRQRIGWLFPMERFISEWNVAFAAAVASPSPIPISVAEPREPSSYRGEIAINESAGKFIAGRLGWVGVRVRNLGSGIWHTYTRFGFAEVKLSYHWLKPTGDVVIWDGLRTPLPSDLRPGEEACFEAFVRSPETAGAYILEWDLVCEFVAWFSWRGNPTVKTEVTVAP